MGCVGTKSKTIMKSVTKSSNMQLSIKSNSEIFMKPKIAYKIVIHEVESPSSYSIYGYVQNKE